MRKQEYLLPGKWICCG